MTRARLGRLSVLPFLVLCGVLTVASHVEAGSYTFTRIALGGDVTSAGPINGNLGSPAINNDGTVAFSVDLAGGGQGIFTGSGSALTTRFTTGNGITAPGFLSINRSGVLAFWAGTPQGTGIFVAANGDPTVVAVGCGIDGPPALNDKGTVVFEMQLLTGGTGLVLGGKKSLTTLYDDSEDPFGLPEGQTGHAFGLLPTINNRGRVAFISSLPTGVTGVFTGNGGAPTTIATNEGPIQSYFGQPDINESGTVVFGANLDGGVAAILVGNGGALTTIADTSGAFGTFDQVATINEAGTVAFLGQLKTGGRGIFTGPDPVAHKVIATGDPLFGSVVTNLQLNRGLNDRGQVAFVAQLANGMTGIFRANPVPVQ